LEHGHLDLSTQCQQRELLGQHVVIHWLPSRLGDGDGRIWHSVLDRHWRYAAADDLERRLWCHRERSAPLCQWSNKFCYPIPLTAPIEGGPTADTGSDRHVLYIDTAGAPSNCTLYELYNAQNPTGSSGWTASNGAIFHLGSNALRTDGWTSADAAGLPVLPGLVRYDEVMAGEISPRHQIHCQPLATGLHPPGDTRGRQLQHHSAANGIAPPPEGVVCHKFVLGPTLVILTAMKKYGIILADNGSNWYISGETNQGWSAYMDDLVSGLRQVHGSDFEVVDTGPVSTAGL